MAETEIELKLTWENGVAFEMTAKENAESVIQIVRMEENGNLAQLWPNIRDIITNYAGAIAARIGKEMSA